MRTQLTGLGIVALLILFLISTSFYTITSGTVGVLATFGKFDVEVKQPGIHFKLPIVQTIRTFDIKLQTVNYQGVKEDESDEGVIDKTQIEVLDQKNLPIGIDLSVQFIPIPDQANVILEKYGVNYFDKLINPMVRDIVRNVVGKYGAESIADQRGEIGEQIRAELGTSFDRIPFTLNNAALRNIRLPDIVLKKIKEVQLAKQEEARLTMVEKQARREQEIKTIQANTRLIETTTRAKADAEKQRIEADARAYKIMAEAKAEAEANLLIAASITSELIAYRGIDKWRGFYPQTLVGDAGTGLILNLPNTGAPGEATPQNK
jgi:regulator of protease activity HflC (stomatin/prohibitin superfamily)